MSELISLRDELADLAPAGPENEAIELRLDSPFNMPESFRFDFDMHNNFVLEIRYLADAPAQEEPTEQCILEKMCKIQTGKFSRRIYRMQCPITANGEAAVKQVQHFIVQFAKNRNPAKYETLIKLIGETTARLDSFLHSRPVVVR